eukprot:scaffold204670_cov31-Tisochrysis_lutea.AAC.1
MPTASHCGVGHRMPTATHCGVACARRQPAGSQLATTPHPTMRQRRRDTGKLPYAHRRAPAEHNKSSVISASSSAPQCAAYLRSTARLCSAHMSHTRSTSGPIAGVDWIAAVAGSVITSSPDCRLAKTLGSCEGAAGLISPSQLRSGAKNCGKGNGSARGAVRAKSDVLALLPQGRRRGMTSMMASGSDGKPRIDTLCANAETWDGGSDHGDRGTRCDDGATAPPRGILHERRPATSGAPSTGGGNGSPRIGHARLKRGAACRPQSKR